MSDQEWKDLGAEPAIPVRRRRGTPGSAAWTIRSSGDQESWVIHAAHRPYIEREGVQQGPDTWRVAVKVNQQLVEEHSVSSPGWFDGFEVWPASEQAALEVVRWLLAEAAGEGNG